MNSTLEGKLMEHVGMWGGGGGGGGGGGSTPSHADNAKNALNPKEVFFKCLEVFFVLKFGTILCS